MFRELKWPLVALLCCMILASPVAAAAYSAYFTQRVDESDDTLVRDDISSADVTTYAYSATADIPLLRKELVYIRCEFASASDTCTIVPVFWKLDGTYAGTGDEKDFTASTNLTPDGLYDNAHSIGAVYWETRGAGFCVPWVTAVSGTVDVYGGTR